jgi:hypothetical protein
MYLLSALGPRGYLVVTGQRVTVGLEIIRPYIEVR